MVSLINPPSPNFLEKMVIPLCWDIDEMKKPILWRCNIRIVSSFISFHLHYFNEWWMKHEFPWSPHLLSLLPPIQICYSMWQVLQYLTILVPPHPPSHNPALFSHPFDWPDKGLMPWEWSMILMKVISNSEKFRLIRNMKLLFRLREREREVGGIDHWLIWYDGIHIKSGFTTIRNGSFQRNVFRHIFQFVIYFTGNLIRFYLFNDKNFIEMYLKVKLWEVENTLRYK